jgi:hypothetical protein
MQKMAPRGGFAIPALLLYQAKERKVIAHKVGAVLIGVAFGGLFVGYRQLKMVEKS